MVFSGVTPVLGKTQREKPKPFEDPNKPHSGSISFCFLRKPLSKRKFHRKRENQPQQLPFLTLERAVLICQYPFW
jgi:hypothetical protein